MACIELWAKGQNSITLKSKDLATRGFQKKFLAHPSKPAEAEPSFRKVSLPPENYACFSPLTSGLESFGHKSTPWIEDYCPKF